MCLIFCYILFLYDIIFLIYIWVVVKCWGCFFCLLKVFFYLYLSNVNDIFDLFKYVLYGFIVMMLILILFFMVYNLCCCGINDKKWDRIVNICCCKVFFLLIYDFFLFGFFWKYYLYLVNIEDVFDWYKYIMYGMIGILLVLILFFMVWDICCCSSINKEEKEEDVSKYYFLEDSENVIDIILDFF